jgi:uncharacterized protein
MVEQVLLDFIRALRQSGVRISVAETMDAVNAAKFTGYADREILRNTLGATLAKSRREEEIFETCFDRFFAADDYPDIDDENSPSLLEEGNEQTAPLTEMILSGDMASLAASLREAADRADVKNISFFTQKALFGRRILQAMGVEDLIRDIKVLSGSGNEEDRLTAEYLKQAKDVLRERVRDFVEKQYSLFAKNVTDELLERYLKDARLSNVEERDFMRMHVLIRKMVKRLNDVHSRRKKTAKRGILDLKKTLRANVAYNGLIVVPKWKTKKINRPDIVAICDISRSVEKVVRFFLLFLYSLNDSLAKVRSFVFCSNLVQASHVFENYRVEEALDRILKGKDLDLMLSSTDYGRSFMDFKEQWLDRVTQKTTIMILGDARNNFGNPRTEIFKLLQERSKRIVWLNPEPRSFWGTGDSEMKRYLPYCFLARECSTVNHIQRVVDYMLRTQN